MRYTIKNKYGELAYSEVSEYMPISQISWEKVPEDCFTNLDDLEKIALITENKEIQPCVSMVGGALLCYFLRHSSSSIAAICKLELMNFSSKRDPATELARPTIYGPI